MNSLGLWTYLSLVSVAILIATALLVPWYVRRLRPDFLVRPSIPPAGQTSWRRVGLQVARNLAGAVLLVAGIAMLALPGQGLLTIMVALLLLDYPGKQRLVRRLLGAPIALRGINALRRRGNRPPLDRPPSTADDT